MGGRIIVESVADLPWNTQSDQNINFCKLCEVICKEKNLGRLCRADHLRRGINYKYAKQINICHVGLFNVSFPIEVDGEPVASILLGQIKIKGRESESDEAFKKFIEDAPILRRDKDSLEKLYSNLAPVSPEALGYNTIYHTKCACEIIKNLLTEEKYYRARIRSTTHELLLPMQALIIAAENLKNETYEKDLNLEFIKEAGSNILFEVSKLHMYALNMRKMMVMPVIKQKNTFKLMPIYPIINQARKKFEVEAGHKDIKIYNPSYTGGNFPSIPIEENEITIALNNLYSNAIKYSYDRPMTTTEKYISTECYDETILETKYFVIEVSNFGVGILDHEITSGKIYWSGYRGELARDRNRTGSGVGLYLIKEIIEKIHSGILEVICEDKKSAYLVKVRIKLPY